MHTPRIRMSDPDRHNALQAAARALPLRSPVHAMAEGNQTSVRQL